MLAWVLIIAVFVGILIFFVGTNLLNLRRMRRLEHFPDMTIKHRLSVIVPARNEKKNIESCVFSILAQDIPDLELIVVDDGSTDGTSDILERLASEHPRLTAIQGRELPRGWTGKNWACWQGFIASHGEIVLFTDADTRHGPGALSRAVHALRSSGAGLLSALIHQETHSFGEKTLIPVLFWLAYSLFPFPLMNAFSSIPLSFGNGQFMMFRRDAYLAVGGHRAIRNNVFDDMTLADRVRKSGIRTLVVDGSRFISCRMYAGLAEAFRGLCKNIFALFRRVLSAHIAIPLYVLGLGLFGLTIFGPILSIGIDSALVLTGFPPSPSVLGLASAGILLSWITLSITYARFRFPLRMILLYPFSITVFLATALASMILTSLGRTEWKGRVLEVEAAQ
jgi:chlorobactene glucosyltransferase